MLAEGRRYVPEEEFLRRPESLVYAELLDGEVVVSPSPQPWHQVLVLRLARVLDDWAQAHGPGMTAIAGPMDLRFGPDRILHPDVCLVPRHLGPSDRIPVTTLPVLCVEVLSSNHWYDRTTKRLVYGQAGVPELWAVDPAGSVEVFRGDALARRDVHEGRLQSPTLPGLSVDLDALFRP